MGKFDMNVDSILNSGKDSKSNGGNDIKSDIKATIKIDVKQEDKLIPISIQVRESQYKKVKKYAKKSNRKINEFMRYMIDKFFEAVEEE